MKRIIPHFWFKKEALEATEFYCQVFPNSKLEHKLLLPNTPSGDCDLVSFQIFGTTFMAISAGPLFKPNYSISFSVFAHPNSISNPEEWIESTWKKLSEGGKILMPLDSYPFCKKYGWLSDRFNVSWQLILQEETEAPKPFLATSLFFVKENFTKGKQAVEFYTQLFSKLTQTQVFTISFHPESEAFPPETVAYAEFKIGNNLFTLTESPYEKEVQFTEGVSLLVECETQEEIDYLWNSLSHVKEAEECGWLKDKYGVSWQITTPIIQDLLIDETKKDKALEKILKMKKIEIQPLLDLK